jgi:hypothetical protein
VQFHVLPVLVERAALPRVRLDPLYPVIRRLFDCDALAGRHMDALANIASDLVVMVLGISLLLEGLNMTITRLIGVSANPRLLWLDLQRGGGLIPKVEPAILVG